MRVAALCDVHGNVHALEAALGDVQAEGVDAIVFGGDLYELETVETAILASGHPRAGELLKLRPTRAEALRLLSA